MPRDQAQLQASKNLRHRKETRFPAQHHDQRASD
jgi:hypothetical protein